MHNPNNLINFVSVCRTDDAKKRKISGISQSNIAPEVALLMDNLIIIK